MTQNKCMYCSNNHKPYRCVHYGKKCARCGKANHFEWMYRSQSCKLLRDGNLEKCPAIHDRHQDTEKTELATCEFDAVESNIFNFQSMWSVIITKLKTKHNQTGKYIIDTGKEGNLIPIRMYKTLYPHTNILELYKSIEKNSIGCK